MIVRAPLTEYKPDQSNNSGVLLVAENIYPAMDGYRSVGDVLTVSNALAAAFQGGASAIANDGTAYLVAGTAAALYRLDGTGAWAALTTGLTITGRWRFAQFGNYSVAVNGAATREIDLALGTAAAISGAPIGTSVAVVGDHVVIGEAGGNISKVQWSAFRDHTGWTDGTNQAGSLPMQTGGRVMAVMGGEYGIILQRDRIARMTRTGESSAPFTFEEVSSNFGCASGATVAQAGRSIFFRSDRGFMALEDGQALRPIGSEKVDRTFESLVSRNDLDNIYTAVDPQNKLVMWGVPGTPGTLWVYNFELDRWAVIKVRFKGLFPGFTTGLGIDEIAALYPGGIDTIGLTIDDPRWDGGNPRLYLLTAENKIGSLSGDTLEARIDTGFMQLTQGRRARLKAVRPIWDGTGGMTLNLNAKARIGDAGTMATANTLRASGTIPIRAAGRFISTSLTIAAGTDWDYIQGLEYDVERGGER